MDLNVNYRQIYRFTYTYLWIDEITGNVYLLKNKLKELKLGTV